MARLNESGNTIRYISTKKGVVDVFHEVFIKDYNVKTKAQNTERIIILGEIDALNKCYENATFKECRWRNRNIIRKTEFRKLKV